MLPKLLIVGLLLAVSWLAVDTLLIDQRRAPELAAPRQLELEPIVPPPVEGQPNRVADISVHTPEELELLFERVERVLDRPRSGNETPLISLVLHGPEIEFFVIENYEKHKAIVDRAAKLAALGAVDISICQTQMRNHGIATDDVPSFLRQVPFGPEEIERLLENGYVYM